MAALWKAADYCWMLNHGIAVYVDTEHEQLNLLDKLLEEYDS